MFFSWGSGANPWGPEKEDQFQKPTHYDGNLEVVGITGVVHMAQIHSGLRTGIRVAQGGHVSSLYLDQGLYYLRCDLSNLQIVSVIINIDCNGA